MVHTRTRSILILLISKDSSELARLVQWMYAQGDPALFSRGDMHGETRNQWSKLRKHAAEQDPQKVLQSARKINRMLEEKEQRLTHAQKTKTHADQTRCRK